MGERTQQIREEPDHKQAVRYVRLGEIPFTVTVASAAAWQTLRDLPCHPAVAFVAAIFMAISS
jgi:hypothetical protein